MITTIMEGIKTDAEKAAAFEQLWAEQLTQFEMFTEPEAGAAGQMTAGVARGSGVQDALTRARMAYESVTSSARQRYYDQADTANEKYLNLALSLAKTPAEIDAIYSQVGTNLATTQEIMQRAQNLEFDRWKEEVLLPANKDYLEAMTDQIDTNNMLNMLQVAAVEAGFEANATLQKMQMYERQYGIDPYLALAYAWSDMSMLTTYGQQQTGPSGGAMGASGLAALGSIFGDMGKK
jgi:hypothetical protein